MSEPGPDVFAQRFDAIGLRDAGEAAVSADLTLESQARADLRLFVDRNPDKFLPAFDAMEAGRWGRFVCWPGLFFPQAWFLYRKLYGWAALSCALPILVSSYHIGGGMQHVVASAPVLVAFAGRQLYVASARKTIKTIRAATQNEDEARALIRRAGGVSSPGAVVGGLIFSVSVVASFIVGFTGAFHAGW